MNYYLDTSLSKNNLITEERGDFVAAEKTYYVIHENLISSTLSRCYVHHLTEYKIKEEITGRCICQIYTRTL